MTTIALWICVCADDWAAELTVKASNVKLGRCGRRVSLLSGRSRVPVQIGQPTSNETRMWGKQLAALLALYTGKGVAPIMYTSAKFE